MPIPVRWDVGRAIRLYGDDWSLRQISSDVGVAVSAVQTQLLKAGVEFRQPSPHTLEDGTVRIPTSEIDRDATDAGFDQSPRG